MSEEMKVVWLSKYALSGGIKREEAKCCETYARIGYSLYRLGVDVHFTEEGALAAAEKARLARIKSLQKQITKLERLSFDPRYTLTEAGYRAVMQQGAKLNGEVKAGEETNGDE